MLEIDVKYEQIKSIYRVKSTERGSLNINKLALFQEETKYKILSSAKEYYRRNGNLATRQLNINGTSSVIYLNEQLTNCKRKLLGKSKEQRKYGFNYLWVKNGKIFVIKKEKDRSFLINSEQEIERFINN